MKILRNFSNAKRPLVMKTPFLPFALYLIGITFAEEAPPPPPVPQSPSPAVPAKQESKPTPQKIRFKGKTGAPTTCTVTATRNGKPTGIRLVILAPGNEGVTRKSRPRLWWHQSEATAARDLEFTLSRRDEANPTVLLQRPLLAMEKGFNFVDLEHPGFNNKNITLESGGIYQWTIRLVSEETAPQVFCRMKVGLSETPNTAPDLGKLAESGNWYELFDAVATSAQDSSSEAGHWADLRLGLLQQIGLAAAVK